MNMHIHNLYMNEKQHYIKHRAIMPSFLPLYSFSAVVLLSVSPLIFILSLSLSLRVRSHFHLFNHLSLFPASSFPVTHLPWWLLLSLYLSICPSSTCSLSLFLHLLPPGLIFPSLFHFSILKFPPFSVVYSYSFCSSISAIFPQFLLVFFFAPFSPFCFPSLDLRLLPF